MSPFIRDMDERICTDLRSRALGYLDNARHTDPKTYPSDAGWRVHFVRQARNLWHSYLSFRKEIRQ